MRNRVDFCIDRSVPIGTSRHARTSGSATTCPVAADWYAARMTSSAVAASSAGTSLARPCSMQSRKYRTSVVASAGVIQARLGITPASFIELTQKPIGSSGCRRGSGQASSLAQTVDPGTEGIDARSAFGADEDHAVQRPTWGATASRSGPR